MFLPAAVIANESLTSLSRLGPCARDALDVRGGDLPLVVPANWPRTRYGHGLGDDLMTRQTVRPPGRHQRLRCMSCEG